MNPYSITSIIPRPRPVRFGGVVWPVWEATLTDLAELQGWLNDGWADPLDGVEQRLAGGPLEGGERREFLVAAHERAEAGAPVDGTPEAEALFATDKGLGVLLCVALRRGTPGLTLGDVAAAALAATAPEYAKLRRVFFGVSGLKILTEMLLGRPPSNPHSGSWGKAIYGLARSHGWSVAYVYSMSVTEFTNARHNGEPPLDEGRPVMPGEDLAEAQRKACLAVHGKTPEEVFGPGPVAPVDDSKGWVDG
jgi:hypothetical protein